MTLVKNALRAFSVFALISGLTVAAHAASIAFNYTSTDGTVTATGTLTGTLVGDMYDVTSGTIDVTGGPITGSGILLANPNFPGTTTNTTLAGGGTYLTYDDALTPDANPELDGYGLLFEIDGTSLNIWGNGPDSYTAFGGNYALTDSGIFSATVTPEPSSLALLGTGLLGLVGLTRRRFLCA